MMGDKVIGQYSVYGIGTIYFIERENETSPIEYFAQVGGKKRKDKVYGMSQCLDDALLFTRNELKEEIKQNLIKTSNKKDELFDIFNRSLDDKWFNAEEGKTLEDTQ